MGTNKEVCVGIDDIAIHFPRLYMDMKDFADLRGEDYGKLNKGLGLKAMSIPDVHEGYCYHGCKCRHATN